MVALNAELPKTVVIVEWIDKKIVYRCNVCESTSQTFINPVAAYQEALRHISDKLVLSVDDHAIIDQALRHEGSIAADSLRGRLAHSEHSTYLTE